MPATTTEAKYQAWRRVAWFVALWLGGIAVVGAVAYGLRGLIKILA